MIGKGIAVSPERWERVMIGLLCGWDSDLVFICLGTTAEGLVFVSLHRGHSHLVCRWCSEPWSVLVRRAHWSGSWGGSQLRAVRAALSSQAAASKPVGLKRALLLPLWLGFCFHSLISIAPHSPLCTVFFPTVASSLERPMPDIQTPSP